MIGVIFGNLTVLGEVGKNKRGILFECICKCGNKRVFPGKDLRSGNNKSCGCLLKKHGMSSTRIYISWQNMKKRCNDPNYKDFKNYGGRGIKYCEKWETFEGFYEDMKEGYEDSLTLDRINVDGDYTLDNCRWVTLKEQSNNKRNNHFLEYNGEVLTLSQMANKYNIDFELFRHRIKKGWSVEKALSNKTELEVISFKGEIKTVSEFAKEYGMTYHQLKKRLMRNWTVERALTQPLRKRQ
jgi:hypothetical protein